MSAAGQGNRRPGASPAVGAALATLLLLVVAPFGVIAGQQPATPSVLVLLAAHARAHPHAVGAVTLVRYEHAHDRTTTEHGTLRLTAEGALLRLGEHTEILVRADGIESLDASSSPPILLVASGETPWARYARLLAGEEPSTWLGERILARRDGRIDVEIVPLTSWTGLERAVLRVVEQGPDAGRIERVLWLDGLGNWQRLGLEQLRYPARLDVATLALTPRADARRVEL